jgi:hypothetical protein
MFTGQCVTRSGRSGRLFTKSPKIGTDA